MRISDWSSDVCSSDLAAARSPIDALLASRERPGEALRLADTILSRDATHCLALTVRADIPLRQGKIGRASCRERVCQYVSIPVVAVSFKKQRTCKRRQK